MIYRPIQPPQLQPSLLGTHYRYQEYAPRVQLQHIVACYWSSTFEIEQDSFSNPNSNPPLYRIIPDGCVDIIFDLDASSVSQGAFVSALMPTYEVFTPTQNMNFLGIRMYMESVQAIIGCPIAELHGEVLLEQLWGRLAVDFFEQIVKAPDMWTRMDMIEQQLCRALYQYDIQPYAVHPLLSHSLQIMYASRGQIDMSSMVNEVHYSERTIRRIFKQELGISPKEILNIIRFQSVLQAMHRFPHYSMSELAISCGYYDQSHLINSFQRYYGLSPGQIVLT